MRGAFATRSNRPQKDPVTMSDCETWRVRLGVLAVSVVMTGPTAFAQEIGEQPLTLKRAVALSVAHSSELALATARHAVAEGQEAQARAPFRPSLFTGSGAAYTNGFPLTWSSGAPSVFNLAYVQTLFNPVLRGQVRAAKERTEVERLGLDRSRDAVILRTAIVFLDLVHVRHALDVQHRARDAAIPVIYVNDNFGKWQSNFSKLITHCLEENVRGRPIVELLQPTDDDYFVLKPKQSGFYASTLDILLAYLQVESLIITGVAGNICVLFTAHDAYMRDFHLVIPADCIASKTVQENASALKHMKNVLKADIRPSMELDMRALKRKAE